MISRENIKEHEIAIYDEERKGIFIHRDQLKSSPFEIGDRFTVLNKTLELFSLTIKKDDNGDIFHDKKGIFIARTRRIDLLLGGIFGEYVIYFDTKKPDSIRLRPLEIVLNTKLKEIIKF